MQAFVGIRASGQPSVHALFPTGVKRGNEARRFQVRLRGYQVWNSRMFVVSPAYFGAEVAAKDCVCTLQLSGDSGAVSGRKKEK